MSACSGTPSLAMHKAYALYKSDKFNDALTVLDGVPAADADCEGAVHLRSQILFRLNRFDACVGLYEKLLAILDADPEADPADVDDARLNLAASLVGAGRSRELLSHSRFKDVVDAVKRGGSALRSLDAPYELLYNVACALADDGATGLAMRALSASLAAGEAGLREDGVEPQAVADELAVVRAQAAYLLQKAHYDEAAVALYDQVTASRPSDVTVAASVSSNLAQLRAGKELLDVYKKLRALGPSVGNTNNSSNSSGSSSSSSAPAGLSRLLRRQRLAVTFNRALLSYRVKRAEEASAALAEVRAGTADILGSETGTADAAFARDLAARADVLAAAVEALGATDGGNSGLLTKLTSLATASKSSSVGSSAPAVSHALAAQVVLLIEEGRGSEAAAALGAAAQAGAATVPPAVTASLAQLLLSGGQTDAALKFLTSAIDAWKTAGASTTGLAQLLHARAAVRSSPAVLALEEAAADYRSIADLPSLPTDHKAAALACLAMVHAQQAATGSSSSSAAADGYGDAQGLLQEAAALAGPLTPLPSPSASRRGSVVSSSPSSRRGSVAGLVSPAASSEPLDLDTLEWSTAESLMAKAGGPPTPRGAASASFAADSSAAAVAGAAGGKTPAQIAARKKRQLARRARAREAYLAKLKASGRYDVMGIPPPDPERWLPKRERTYGRKGARRKLLAKSMNVSSGGAQGAAAGGLTEQLTRELDAKARVDAAKASGKGAAASSSSSAAPPSPAPVLPAGAGKRKGAKGKR